MDARRYVRCPLPMARSAPFLRRAGVGVGSLYQWQCASTGKPEIDACRTCISQLKVAEIITDRVASVDAERRDTASKGLDIRRANVGAAGSADQSSTSTEIC